MSNNTNNIRPNHYKMSINGMEVEAKDIMKAIMTDEQYIGFLYGNCIKYILRAFKKNGVEDLIKTEQYLYWLRERIEMGSEEEIEIEDLGYYRDFKYDKEVEEKMEEFKTVNLDEELNNIMFF